MNYSSSKLALLPQSGAVARAYNSAGGRYGSYADGNSDHLFRFEGSHAFADREVWAVLEQHLHQLRVRGIRELRLLDLGCGPGTWLRRIIGRARQMGFIAIRARGIDIAASQIDEAVTQSRRLAAHKDVQLTFETGDIRARLAEADGSVDLCLCLYGVLNHLRADELAPVFAEISRVLRGKLVATTRAIGSMPTIYVDAVEAARRFHQDNENGRLDVEFQDGHSECFSSHLFSAATLRKAAGASLGIADLRGLDLFHGRFANDARWNPPEAAASGGLLKELAVLERRYGHEPAFIDHATHLLLVAQPSVRARAA